MKVIRYKDSSGDIHFGALQPQQQANGTGVEASPSGMADSRGNGINAVRLEGDLYDGLRPTGEQADVTKLLAPVAPTAVMGIGLNYRRHADESGAKIPEYPVLFFKTPNSIQNPGDPIEIPSFLKSEKVDYECELAVVIGRKCKNASKSEALDYVLGYTCANDVSARDWQIEYGGGQWSRGKTFDTFLPLGPSLVTADEIADPADLQIKTILNEKVVQDWNTNDMIFDIPSLIAFLSGSTTLLPGTVIITGTPHGVGMAQKPPRWLRPGDDVTIEIEGIGALTNPVVQEKLQ